jgi:hypothetical protein
LRQRQAQPWASFGNYRSTTTSPAQISTRVVPPPTPAPPIRHPHAVLTSTNAAAPATASQTDEGRKKHGKSQRREKKKSDSIGTSKFAHLTSLYYELLNDIYNLL